MTLKNRTSKLLGGFIVLGVAVVATATVAFACTTYQGKETVTAGGKSSVTQGDNNCGHTGGCGFANGSMTYCSTSLGTPASLTASAGGSITVTVDPTTSCPSGYGQNQLATGTYDVNFINGTSSNGSRGAISSSDVSIENSEDCMTWNGGSITPLDHNYSVNSVGHGSATESIASGQTANTGGYLAGICVSTTNSDYGNEDGLALT